MPRLYLVDVARPAAIAPRTSQRPAWRGAGAAAAASGSGRLGPAACSSRTSASSENATAVTSVTAMCE